MIKIVVFTNSGMYEVEKEIGGFPNAQAAAHHRDHNYDLCSKYTKLEQDVRDPVYSGNYGDTAMESNGSEGTSAGKAQVIQYQDTAGHFWAGVRFYGLVSVFGGGAVFSLFCLIGSVLAGPR